MKRAIMLAAAFTLAAVLSASAQTYHVARQTCNFTPGKAARVWLIKWDESLADTLVPVFIGRSITVAADGQHLVVAFDSVKGRGGARRAKLTLSQATADTGQWYRVNHLDVNLGTLAPDSTSADSTYRFWKLERVTTSSPTLDSTAVASTWFDPYDGINHDTMYWSVTDSTTARISFVKVTGDPTMYYGRNQRALLRVQAVGPVPAALDSMERLP